MVMRKHQRYFPVYDASSALLPAFVTVANGPIDETTVQVQKRLMLRPVHAADTADVSLAPITDWLKHNPELVLSFIRQALPSAARQLDESRHPYTCTACASSKLTTTRTPLVSCR